MNLGSPLGFWWREMKNYRFQIGQGSHWFGVECFKEMYAPNHWISMYYIVYQIAIHNWCESHRVIERDNQRLLIMVRIQICIQFKLEIPIWNWIDRIEWMRNVWRGSIWDSIWKSKNFDKVRWSSVRFDLRFDKVRWNSMEWLYWSLIEFDRMWWNLTKFDKIKAPGVFYLKGPVDATFCQRGSWGQSVRLLQLNSWRGIEWKWMLSNSFRSPASMIVGDYWIIKLQL